MHFSIFIRRVAATLLHSDEPKLRVPGAVTVEPIDEIAQPGSIAHQCTIVGSTIAFIRFLVHTVPDYRSAISASGLIQVGRGHIPKINLTSGVLS